MPHLEYSEEWGRTVQQTIDETMEKLHEWAQDGEDEATEPETPSGIYFCGCYDCEFRERTYLTMLLAARGVRDGELVLVEDET